MNSFTASSKPRGFSMLPIPLLSSVSCCMLRFPLSPPLLPMRAYVLSCVWNPLKIVFLAVLRSVLRREENRPLGNAQRSHRPTEDPFGLLRSENTAHQHHCMTLSGLVYLQVADEGSPNVEHW